MIVYLYAISDSVLALEGLVGAGGESLESIAADHLVAIGSQLPDRLPVDHDHLIAQDLVVRALHERATALLPMRFGSSFASRVDAEEAIRMQQASLAERLATVRHREQMTIRILGALGASTNTGALGAAADAGAPAAAPASAPDAPGTSYLKSRARPEAVAPLLDALSPITRGTIVERGKTAGVVATVYHLIDRGTSDDYRSAVERVAHEWPALSVRVSGPAPCYAFG